MVNSCEWAESSYASGGGRWYKQESATEGMAKVLAGERNSTSL
jgi:hypothetical protein